MKKFLNKQQSTFLRKIMGFYGKDLNELDEITFTTIENLLEAIYKIAPKVLEHSFRVAVKCMEVAAELNLSDSEVRNISLGALLHDMGVIGIKKELFTKKTRWNKDELSEYYKHSAIGKEIIEPISSLRHILPFIEKHHEYLDGSGYPNALLAQEIPFEIRILTVVNDFDMMSKLFPWGEKCSIEESLKNLRKNASILYDEKVVETFIRLVERK